MRHCETLLYCKYFALPMLYSRNSSLTMLQSTGFSLVFVRTDAGLGSFGLAGVVDLVSLVTFRYTVSDNTRKRCLSKPSPRSEGIATALEINSSCRFLMVVDVGFSPSPSMQLGRGAVAMFRYLLCSFLLNFVQQSE